MKEELNQSHLNLWMPLKQGDEKSVTAGDEDDEESR